MRQDVLSDARAGLNERIERRAAVVGVIGLGYVGLPLACLYANGGFEVRGIDIDAERVALIARGTLPFRGIEPGLAEALAKARAGGRLAVSTDYTQLRDADVVLIAVETPVDDDHRPRYAALTAACRELGGVLRPGTLVIVESTVAPGTMAGIVGPTLEASSGLVAGKDFFVGHCPERVTAGRLIANLRSMNRVCGGDSPTTAELMRRFYSHVVQADLDLADCVTAELVKTVENAYRDVNIAFANEVALICEAAGGNVWRVRELVNKSPGRLMLRPGGGVGGHCIPKDPWLLAAGAAGTVPARVLEAARKVNDTMPDHVADLVERALRDRGLPVLGAHVCILGYAYREDSDDTRNSPSATLVHRLLERGSLVTIHDPYVAEYQGSLIAAIEAVDAVVLMVRHAEYAQIDLREFPAHLRTPILVDACGAFDEVAAREAGLSYLRLGSSG